MPPTIRPHLTREDFVFWYRTQNAAKHPFAMPAAPDDDDED